MMEEKVNNNFPLMFVFKLILVFAVVTISLNFTVSETVKQIIKGVSTFLIPSIILSILRFGLISIYQARHANRSVRGNFVLGINRLTAILNAVFLVIAILISFGIKPIEFLTSLTIVAMAIAVLFRDYITNMISGLYIMFSEQLSVGDRIKVGDYKGRIVDITFAHLELQNEEDDIVMVPNNLVFTNLLLNLSARRSNLFAVRFSLPLNTAVDILSLEKELKKILYNHPSLDPKSDVDFRIVQIGKDYVDYKIELHAISSSNRLHKQIENEVLKEILIIQRSQNAKASEL